MRVYIDTSVFGGYFDEEFAVQTKRFFRAIWQGKITALLSEALIRELENAPENVRAL